MDRQAPGGTTSFNFGWGDAAGKTLFKFTHLLYPPQNAYVTYPHTDMGIGANYFDIIRYFKFDKVTNIRQMLLRYLYCILLIAN
jgi:hypothetical protein